MECWTASDASSKLRAGPQSSSRFPIYYGLIATSVGLQVKLLRPLEE
jgi:hypothetical protein